jgi:hypothetical protein
VPKTPVTSPLGSYNRHVIPGAPATIHPRQGFCWLDGATEPVCLIVDPGDEEGGVRVVCQTSVPTRQSPQTITRHRLATLVLELAEEGTTPRIEGSDVSIAELADEHVVAELPEPFGGQSQASRSVERTMRSEAPDEVPSGVEDNDECFTARGTCLNGEYVRWGVIRVLPSSAEPQPPASLAAIGRA